MKGRVRHHALYGDIPLLVHQFMGRDGNVHEWVRPDPAFRPPLPEGAIRGDPSRQVYCPACHIPKYFYLDEKRECVECGNEFLFEATEQRFWYEQLQFNLHSVAIRCRSCRARRRRAAAYGRQIGEARKAVQQRPGDPAPYLDLAEGLVRQYQTSGVGKLEEAVWAAKQAGKLWPDGMEVEFWEGLSRWQLGQAAEARECLQRFIEHPAVVRRRYRAMVEEARELLKS